MSDADLAERVERIEDELGIEPNPDEDADADHPLAGIFGHDDDDCVWFRSKPAVVAGFYFMSAREMRTASVAGYRVCGVRQSSTHEFGDGPLVVFEEDGDDDE